MKITYEDQTTMVAKHKPWEGIIIGLTFMVLGVMVWLSPNIFGGKPSPLWFPLVFGGVGLLAVLLTTFITVHLDRGSQQVVVMRTRIIGRRQEAYPFGQIKEVKHDLVVRYRGRRGGARHMSQITLVLTDGHYAMLEEFASRGLRGSEIGSRIAHFLNVPFTDTQASTTPTAGEAFSTVRDTIKEAIDKRNPQS